MDQEEFPARLYEQMMASNQRNLRQLQEMAKNENNAIFKTLLKVQSSQKMADHEQAISQLKLSKTQVSLFMKNAISSSNERSYRKIMISVLTHLISRYFAAKKYKDCLETLAELNALLIQTNQFQQALYNLFQLTSLIALSNYKIESNSEFKYPADVQTTFFYMVGKVKMANKKVQQARASFEKILILSSSTHISPYMILRVFDHLSDIKSNKYLNEYQKIKKNTPQKQCSEKIIKTLLQKQNILISKELEAKKTSGLTKKMLWLYLSRLAEKNQNIQHARFFKNLLSSFNVQNNPTVVKQMLQTSIAVEAQQYFRDKINKLSSITLRYHFRKLGGKKTQASNNTNVFYTPIKSPKTSKNEKPQPSIVNMVYSSSKIPLDLNRTKQIVKKCTLGSYLMKINFGNNSVVRKFVRIQEKQLVWADEKIDIDSGSKVKWKHVLGIVYGKVSSNLAKAKFWELDAWRCFSVITSDRSYDFYCEQETDVFFWLQGISYHLQMFYKNQNAYPFYSKGRALWKMALLKMAAKYKSSSRKFKCLNAGAVISFRRHDQLKR